MSGRTIATALGISRTTVNKYIEQLDKTGLSAQQLLALSDADLWQKLEPPILTPSRYTILEALFPQIEKELKKSGITRLLVWQQYKQEHPQGYEYGQFCYHYQQWLLHKGATMHFEHKAGDKLFVDFTGKKLCIFPFPDSPPTEVEVFIAVLGCSQLTYVEASLSQQKEDFLACLENALHYFKGVPKAIVPDNLKAAVTISNRYEAQINETFADFALHYNTAVLPTRAYKPRDKALVEGAVRIVYNRVFTALQKCTFCSLQALNEAIRSELERYNSMLFQGKAYSRRDLFAETDKAVLLPLPAERFQLKYYLTAKVYKNSHIWLGVDKHYYSVPYRYIGKRVKIIYSYNQVEIYNGYERIACHGRDRNAFGYTTLKDHLPSSHQFVSEWHPEKFLSWAADIGPSVKSLIGGVLQSKGHPEQAYKSCIGILTLAKKVGKQRLELACQRALYYQSYSYRTVKNILDKGLEEWQQEVLSSLAETPTHSNIRGKAYYQ
jgi:transposase